ncbi:MAG TPA: hypothetical protein VGL86_29705 [Polyangia bacterium]|jgi:hemolysin activation/secretion protein
MRVVRIVCLAVTLVAPALASAAPDERPPSQKKEQAEKKGALKEHADPKTDVKVQEANVKKLRQNADVERKNGNHVGAWAAEGDAKHAEKLIAKDKQLMEKGEGKHAVDGQKLEGDKGRK